MTELSFCSLCFSFGHQREQCKCNFPSIDFFKSEIEQRSNTIINRYPNFCDSYDEFGPYQVDNTIKKVSTEYNDSIDCFSDQILEKTEKQLYEIFETNLKPNENECLIRYWSIYKITRLVESLVPGSICVPQGSSIIGTFTVDSDVDLIVFNENKNIEEIYEIIEDQPEFENIQLNLRKRISFIACKDKETGINYEILKNSVGGLLSANRVKKMFSEFQNIHLFELSMLVKSFFSGIECHKVYTGGFSSTMIIQICLFFALQTKHMKFSYPLAELFLRILKFLSNVNNYNNVIVCAFDNGCFIERPENFQHQCLFLMHDATERSNLMGNITEKTQFVSDHASKFLSLILKNEQKLSDIFPSFQIKYHMENSVISHILDFSKPSSNVSYHFPKCVMVERKKLFFENTRKLLFLEFEENDKVSLDFCKNFFHPESILKVDNFVLFKYDAKYRISVDLIAELRNKEADGSVQELTNEGLINKYPSLYNQENLHTEYM